MPTALVIIADGSEEMEAVIAIDVLRRGGRDGCLVDQIEVTVAGLEGEQAVQCSRKVTVTPDVALRTVADSKFDVIVLPGGGPGAKRFAESAQVGQILKKQEERDGLIAAICAAPTALASHKIASGKTVTSYPSFGEELSKAGYKYSEERVVVDNTLITSRGPGTAFEFALTLVQIMQDDAKRHELVEAMLVTV